MPEERPISTKEQMLDEMCSLLGGRAAEQLFTGHILSLIHISMGITSQGDCYGITDDGDLYRIDRTTGEVVLVAATFPNTTSVCDGVVALKLTAPLSLSKVSNLSLIHILAPVEI